MKIINFESMIDFETFINGKKDLRYRCKWGSEGTCYLGIDGKAYKVLDGFDDRKIKPQEVITSEDVEIESFVLPETLYTMDDKLLGYLSKCIKGDLLLTYYLHDIDFNKLKIAYKKFVEDVKRISAMHILMYELPNNMLFDGISLYAIDTCEYKRKPEVSVDELTTKNIDLTKLAMKTELDLLCTRSNRNIIDEFLNSIGIDNSEFKFIDEDETKKYKENLKRFLNTK